VVLKALTDPSLSPKKTLKKKKNTGRGCCQERMDTCDNAHLLDTLLKIAIIKPVLTLGTSNLLAGVNSACLKSDAFMISDLPLGKE
jgi:hypothetical protein